MFSVLCSTNDTSFHVFGTQNMKTAAIRGTEYRKHANWCHQWSRVPKTQKLVPSVEQSIENMKTVLCSTDDTSFHVFGTLFH
jgi:hypothetical protein